MPTHPVRRPARFHGRLGRPGPGARALLGALLGMMTLAGCLPVPPPAAQPPVPTPTTVPVDVPSPVAAIPAPPTTPPRPTVPTPTTATPTTTVPATSPPPTTTTTTANRVVDVAVADGFSVGLEPGETGRPWRDADGTHVLVQARWDRLQTGTGQPLAIAELAAVQAQIDDAVALGLEVIFEIATQYPPTSVRTTVPSFVEQTGRSWSGGPGADVRDWIFTEIGRSAVGDFIDRVIDGLDLDAVWALRTGGGWYNELHYPPSGGGGEAISYWGFGRAPQQGVGLAPDQRRTPLPGYVYGAGTAAQDATWAAWYLDALVTFERWLLDRHRRAGWDGPLFVMHPGYGMRDTWRPTEDRWRRELAEGNDWRRQLGAYGPDVHPWSTWLDAPEVHGRTEDAMAPWRKLHQLAAAAGRDDLLWGENTAGAGLAGMDRIFADSGALALGYRGLHWVTWADLVDGGTGPTLEQLRQRTLARRHHSP